jgi:hypothetical protein
VTQKPSDEVAIAVLDAVLEVFRDGGSVRAELEASALRREVFANVALHRYLQDHPGEQQLTEGERYNAVDSGLATLAGEAVGWLLEGGYLAEASDKRIRIGSKQFKVGGKSYVPGTGREEDLFHSIRRVTPKRLALIKASIEALGDLRNYFPILVDEGGNIVDGRHRHAIDKDWPVDRHRIVKSGDRLLVAQAANRGNSWNEEDWKRLRVHREFSVGARAASRDLARIALLEDASRSNRDIGRLVGCDHKTVEAVRGELENTGEIPHFKSSGGRGVTTGSLNGAGKPKQPRADRKWDDPELVDAVRPAVLAGKPVGPVAKALGVPADRAEKAAIFVKGEISGAGLAPVGDPAMEHEHVWECRICGAAPEGVLGG